MFVPSFIDVPFFMVIVKLSIYAPISELVVVVVVVVTVDEEEEELAEPEVAVTFIVPVRSLPFACV